MRRSGRLFLLIGLASLGLYLGGCDDRRPQFRLSPSTPAYPTWAVPAVLAVPVV